MYAVRYVGESDLPPGQDWAMVRSGRSVYLFIKECAVCPQLLEAAWAAYRVLIATGEVPAQRPAPEAVSARR